MYYVHIYSSRHEKIWSWWNSLKCKCKYINLSISKTFFCWFLHWKFVDFCMRWKISWSLTLKVYLCWKLKLLKIYLRCSSIYFVCSVFEIYFFETILPPLKVLTSWLGFPGKYELIFEHIFWILIYLIMKLGQVTDLVISNSFRKYFVWFGELGHKFRPFLICQSFQLIRNQL